MTKDQLSAIAEGLKVRLDNDTDGALESKKKYILSGDLSGQSEARQGFCRLYVVIIWWIYSNNSFVPCIYLVTQD